MTNGNRNNRKGHRVIARDKVSLAEKTKYGEKREYGKRVTRNK